MPFTNQAVVRSTFAFLFIGFLALLGIVTMTFWLQERSQSYFEAAIEARDTRSAAVELRSALQIAESSERGFIVTGNEIYLAPYDTAKAQAGRRLDALKQLLSPGGETSVPVVRLTALTADKFTEMDGTIALKRARRDDEALAAFRSNKGKALMDEANVFFSGITAQADQRLTTGVDEQRSNAGWLRIVSAIGAFVIVAVVGGAAFVLLRYAQELRTARDQVRGLNTELEGRVARRTADLVQARDRAEVLLSEVNHRVANSLALVSSLITMQKKAITDQAAKDALTETQDRIFAISLVHKRLYDSSDVRLVTLDEYLSTLLDHLKTSLRGEGQGVALTYELDPVKIGTDAGVNLGVIVTEWVTNAFKYAYPDGSGQVRVHLRRLSDEQAELIVEDDGVGRVDGAPAKGTGLGSRIVTAIASSIGGEIRYQKRQPGMAASLVFPSGLVAANG